jgi:hypothetical protein
MVGRVDSFLQLIQRAVPELYGAFEAVKPALGMEEEPEEIRTLYAHLEPSNFSHDVLSARANDLSVMPVKNVGWSDWGVSGRVPATSAHIGIQAEWAQNCGVKKHRATRKVSRSIQKGSLPPPKSWKTPEPDF